MYLKTTLGLLLLALTAGIYPAHSVHSAAAALPNEFRSDEVLPQNQDPISGDWDVSFFVQGTTTPAIFKLKLEGDKVTGTVESAHTGPGTVTKGLWTDNKLSFTLDFKKHESIAVDGSLKDGKLFGEFRTEGFVAKWGAKRKVLQNAQTEVTGTSATSADPISGEWEALFEAQGTRVPVTIKFKLDGEKVTGTTDSAHLGLGTLSEGLWMKNKLSFTMANAHMPIAATGELKAGNLVGEFTAGQMQGKWKARRKLVVTPTSERGH